MAIITPVSRIDLSKEINDWNNAIYGKEVRQANTSAFEKIQTIINGTVVNVNEAASRVDEIKRLAEEDIRSSADAVNTATSKAEEALQSAAAAATSARYAATSEANAKAHETSAADSKNKTLEMLSSVEKYLLETAAILHEVQRYQVVISDLISRSGVPLYVDRGDYSSTEIYYKGDMVFHNGSTWVAYVDNILDDEPIRATNYLCDESGNLILDSFDENIETSEKWHCLARGIA